MRFIPLEDAGAEQPQLQFVPLEEEKQKPQEAQKPLTFEPLQDELTEWKPTTAESIKDWFMNLIPGDRAKGEMELLARRYAAERKVSVDEAYRQMKEAVGVRGPAGQRPSGQPMFNPQGTPPVGYVVRGAPYLAEAVLEAPKGLAESVLRTYRGGDIEGAVDKDYVDQLITYLGDDAKEVFIPNIPELLGMDKNDSNYQSLQSAGKSFGYSLATMAASAVAGAATTAVTSSPLAGFGAGMTTAGAVAYRGSKDDFLSRVRDKLNKDSKRVFGRPMSDAEWKAAREKFDGAATEYGAWEAVPEAVTNAIFLKAFAAPAATAKGARLAAAMEKAGALALDQIGETATTYGQNAPELKAGLTKDELTVVDAFKQQFLQSLLTAGVMAGTIKAGQMAKDFYDTQVLPRVNPGSALAKAIEADIRNYAGYTPAAFRSKAATDQARSEEVGVRTQRQKLRQQLGLPATEVPRGTTPPEEPPAAPTGEPPIAPSGAPGGGRIEPTLGEEPVAPIETRQEPVIGEELTPEQQALVAGYVAQGFTEQEAVDRILKKGKRSEIPGLVKPEETISAQEVQARQQAGETAALGLTAEAASLLAAVDAGGVPAIMTNNMKRIAAENGIKVTGATTPNDVIEQLRQKSQGATPALPDAVRQWDRANRSGRQTEWQVGAAESNPAFESLGSAGYNTPAHGMAKVGTLGEAYNNLVSLLSGNIDPNRPLYTAGLTAPAGVGAGTGTAGGYAYRDGPFIITFRQGLTGQPTAADITGVLVNPANAELVPVLQKQFPNLVVRSYNEAADVVNASRATAPEGQVAPAEPPMPPAAKPAVTPPQEPSGETVNVGMPVVELPLKDLTLSKDVPQFKMGADAKGVVEPLGGKFERTGVAPIQVWRRLDGSLEVISGRHRLDLARRSGEKTIPAQVHDEAQGFTPTMAAVLDAELNIRDGQGKVKDYVNYFKASGIEPQDAESRGLLARSTGKRAYTIATTGSDDLIAAVRNDQVGDEAAYYIALNAPNDPRLQAVGLQAVMDGKSANLAINTMLAMKALGVENNTTTDMFGFDDSAMKEAAAMAQVANRKQREIQTRLSAISGAAKNPAVAKAEGIDIRDPEAVNRRINELRQMKAAWDNWATNPELIAEIRQDRGVQAPSLTLRGETEEEIRAREEAAAAEEQRRRAEEEAAKRAEQEAFDRKRAAETTDLFQLGQTAEQQISGMGDLFAPPVEEKPAEPVSLDLMKDGIEGREIPFTEVPNGSEAFQYALGRTEEGGKEAIYRRRANERGTYGGWRWEADKPAAKKEVKANEYFVENLGETLPFPDIIEWYRRAYRNMEQARDAYRKGEIDDQQFLEQKEEFEEIKAEVEQIEAQEYGKPKAAKPVAAPTEKLIKEGRELEGRLFGGAYTLNRMVPKDSPKYKMIMSARERYNALREQAGLPLVTEWTKTPEQLLQKLGEAKPSGIKEPTEVRQARREMEQGVKLTPAVLKRRRALIEWEKSLEPAPAREPEFTADNIVNGEQPAADLPATNRLIFMPCSAKKGGKAGPAMDLYQGVFFQTFRSNVPSDAMPNVVILSAEHGFIGPDTQIEPYDRLLDKARADEMLGDMPKVITDIKKAMAGIPADQIKDVLLVGGKEYQAVMRAALAQMKEDGLIPEDASVNATSGGIGEQRQQLGQYLRALPSQAEPVAKPARVVDMTARRQEQIEREEEAEEEATAEESRVSAINRLKKEYKPLAEKIWQATAKAERALKQSAFPKSLEHQALQQQADELNSVLAIYNELNAQTQLGANVLNALPRAMELVKSEGKLERLEELTKRVAEEPPEGIRKFKAKKKEEPDLFNVEEPIPETIKVNGVDRPTRNSEGRPIHPTEQGIRNFWRWFGDSAVVDGAGRPLVVYHGTTKGTDFSAFRFPAFFTDSAEFAGRYADEAGQAVFHLYLSLRNPVEIDAAEHELGSDAEELANDPAWVRKQERAGHDGLIVRDGGVTVYVAFDPTQIKSATGNVGTFEPTEPSILANVEEPNKPTGWGSVPTEREPRVNKSQEEQIREEQIRSYQAIRQRLAAIPRRVAEQRLAVGEHFTVQALRTEAQNLKAAIDASRPKKDTAVDFLAWAAKQHADGEISKEVFDVIRAAFDKYPQLLEGLRFSVTQQPEGSSATGQFFSIPRILRLYKGSTGVDAPRTIRHELTHSLEQMMTPEQRKVIVDAWRKDLEKAMQKHTDKAHKDYFDAVLEFMANPSKTTQDKVVKLLPSYDMYQFSNPSEYWAVNAEDLLGMQLGGAWQRFKRVVQRLFEGIKQVLGFDNKSDVHRVFAEIMGGEMKRLDTKTVFHEAGAQALNIEEDKRLLNKYGKENTPQTEAETTIADFLANQVKDGKAFYRSAVQNPLEMIAYMGDATLDGLTMARMLIFWYGAGLESRDFERYKGQLMIGDNLAIASVALDNAIHGANIGIEVLFKGGLAYNSRLGRFVAVDRKKGMHGVYKAERALKNRIGKQLGTDIINGYLEAKRSISIMDELRFREVELAIAKDSYEYMIEQGASEEDIKESRNAMLRAKDAVTAVKRAATSVTMSEAEMREFAALDKRHPELREILENFKAVNQNLLKVWYDVGLLSEARYNTLSSIKDYVPWYRIMGDGEDPHTPLQTTTRNLLNIGREKRFKRGAPVQVLDFIVKEGQDTFKVPPSTVVRVEVNGTKVGSEFLSVTPEGELKISMPEDNPLRTGDLVVINTTRQIANIIDNMTQNVMRMTINGIRHYAANRIVNEYATRTPDGHLMTFPSVDEKKGRINYILDGKKIVVEISDPLVAGSIFGLSQAPLDMWAPAAAAANLQRRGVTLSAAFQIKQVFIDAPNAAMVSGVKHPYLLILEVYKGLITALINPVTKKYLGADIEPAINILKAAGIGGFHDPSRSPEKEIKQRLGVMNRNVYQAVMRLLDHIGDSSDMAQRVAVYKRVLAETGNETQAVFQAANVMPFLHRGSASFAQFMVKTVPFMGSSANAIDVFANALVGGNLKGMRRLKAELRLLQAGVMLGVLTLLYCMAVGGSPEYEEQDDQTKLRNFIIPGTDVMIPMYSSSAFVWKAIPEMLYNKFLNESTKNEVDLRRLKEALSRAAIDMLGGPTPVPTLAKSPAEIVLNHNFVTGRELIPPNLKNVEAFEQFDARTSELAKWLSKYTEFGSDGKRLLSPIEAEHLVRGLLGLVGATAGWLSNRIAVGEGQRPESTKRETPIIGSFMQPEVGRRNEDLFYDLKEEVDKKYKTWSLMMDRGEDKEAGQYETKNEKLLDLYQDLNKTNDALGEINSEIRELETAKGLNISAEKRREQINNLRREKMELLDDVIEMRKEAGFDE